MKKEVVIAIMMVGALISCKKSVNTNEIVPSSPKEVNIDTDPGQQCYELSKDTNAVKISFNVNSQQEVNGSMIDRLPGQENVEGSFIGKFYGDTLIADYTYNDKGKSLIKEIILLQKDGSYIEGTGDRILANGKFSFKNKSALKFDTKNTYSKIDCPSR